MGEVDVLKAQIVRRDANEPWGFRLQGGSDVGQPLTIIRVRMYQHAGLCCWQILFSRRAVNEVNLYRVGPKFPHARYVTFRNSVTITSYMVTFNWG